MDTGVGKRLQDQSEALSQAKAMLDGVMDAVALDGNVPERVEPVESASKSVGAEFDGLAHKIGSLRIEVQDMARLMLFIPSLQVQDVARQDSHSGIL